MHLRPRFAWLLKVAVLLVAAPSATGSLALAAQPPRLFQRVAAVRFRAAPADSSPVLVDVGPVLRGARRLLVDLDGGAAVARRRVIRHPGAGSATWIGDLQGEPGSSVILTVRDGLLAGTIQSRQGDFQIAPRPGDAYVLQRVVYGGADDVSSTGSGAILPDLRDLPRPARGAIADIDVLVYYGESARDLVGGARQVKLVIDNYIDGVNEAFVVSDIPARARLVGVGLSPVSEFAAASPLGPFALSSGVRAMRDAVGADLVALVHNGAERCGRAYLLENMADGTGAQGYSSMSITCGTRVFIHELGHTLGFQHDPEANGTSTPAVSPAAYGHWREGSFRTIMATSECQCLSIIQFSNPRLRFGGLPTGIDGERDNALVGATTTPFVSGYRRSRILFTDDFDSGDLDMWDRVRGDLDLVDLEPRESGWALAVPLDARSRPRYVQHRIVGDPEAVDVSLNLDLARGRLQTADEVEILRLVSGKQVQLRLALRRDGGANRLALYTRVDGELVEVAAARLRPRAEERIGVEWRRATTTGAADGVVRLRRGNRLVGALEGLANAGVRLTQGRLGLPTGLAAAAGSGLVRVDDYRIARPPAGSAAPPSSP